MIVYLAKLQYTIWRDVQMQLGVHIHNNIVRAHQVVSSNLLQDRFDDHEPTIGQILNYNKQDSTWGNNYDMHMLQTETLLN